jgi:hypothetical protein
VKGARTEDVVVALLAAPHDPGHAGRTHECLVDPALLQQRRADVALRGGFDLDGDGLAREPVRAVKDGTCVAGRSASMDHVRQRARTAAAEADLLLEHVVPSERERHRGGPGSSVGGAM